MKTNSGSKKRFTLTGTGTIKRKHAFHSHILTKKTKKQKRNLCYSTPVSYTHLEYKLNGFARGVTYNPSFHPQLRMIAEYDSKDFALSLIHI